MGNASSAALKEILEAAEGDQAQNVAKLEKLFKAFDKDKTGAIEGDEIPKFVDALYSWVCGTGDDRMRAKLNDEFGSLVTSLVVMQGLKANELLSKQKFEAAVLKDLDPNGDKKITLEEFTAGIASLLKSSVGKLTNAVDVASAKIKERNNYRNTQKSVDENQTKVQVWSPGLIVTKSSPPTGEFPFQAFVLDPKAAKRLY